MRETVAASSTDESDNINEQDEDDSSNNSDGKNNSRDDVVSHGNGAGGSGNGGGKGVGNKRTGKDHNNSRKIAICQETPDDDASTLFDLSSKKLSTSKSALVLLPECDGKRNN